MHRAIVGLGFDAVVTAWYDDLTERTFDAAGKRVARVFGGVDPAYTGGGEDVILVKLYGDVARPESLVVTRKKMLRVQGNLARRLEDVRPFVRLRPILFVGWDPSDEQLLCLYLAATEALGEHRRRNFIVWPRPRAEDVAEALLQALVTTKETKAALDEAELLDELTQAQAEFDPAAELETLRITRASLINLRLLRSFQVGERPLVELAHDHMAAKIATWIDQAAMQAKLARELLRQQVESWQRHRLLIAPDALRLIHAQREHLRRLSRLEAELLLRSALATGYEAPYRFERACDSGVAADAIALEGLRSANFRTRAAAVIALARLGDRFVDAIIPMLADDYPQVRVAAIASLDRLRPEGAWRALLKYECYVPAGEFIMGQDKEAHRVTLAAFYIGKYPVTNTEYQRFMADRGRGFEMPAGKEQHPVVSVSWYDARDYADWAGMRLLTAVRT